MYKFADEIEEEYRDGLKQLNIMHESLLREYKNARCKESEVRFENELKLIRSMISDMQYAIEWIVHAVEPGNRREISRKSRYQRTQYWADIDLVTFNIIRDDQVDQVSEEDKEVLEEFLNLLTDRERDALISIVAKNNTYEDTAEYMSLSRSSVQVLVNRAMEKLGKGKKSGTQMTFF